MQNYIQRGTLKIANELFQFIEQEALPGSEVSSESFWQGFESLLADFQPLNRSLLAKRDRIQTQMDEYCQRNPNPDIAQYKAFLTEIGYLADKSGPVHIDTQNVDEEIANMAGPQLVVPINNARYALNAANARWGSLYDAAYGTDVISEEDGAEKGRGYNPLRGQKVILFARQWLDTIAPLQQGSHTQSTQYQLTDTGLMVTLKDGQQSGLTDSAQCIGFQGDKQQPSAILIRHNGLHIELQFDAEHPIGKSDPATLKDILVESALTTIMDCEDSVAAVDAQDKTLVYRNWLGLMKGTLSTDVQKGNQTVTRSLNGDREYTDIDGQKMSLPGRSLMFVRNVGHLMTNDAILKDDQPIYEGLMDAMITSLIGKHDLLGNGRFRNSRQGSIYIVKPKMHGPEEVYFADQVFASVEKLLGLAANTLKMGIMDEERRTSVNLLQCIAQAKHRCVFINTGFLDRTGDEIHTSMLAGPFALKGELKARPWITAYEQSNVLCGLSAGLSGRAQIGKGMWPIPDNMADMMEAKLAHPMAGASTAWVPSPTAATLHALHYHQQDVFARQKTLSGDIDALLNDILSVPLLSPDAQLSDEQIQREIDNNVQGILGYVVRWVHQGIGCSKVPDINNVGLMEDRATLRISSQHIANWLQHGIVDETLVMESMLRMAGLVDEQNAQDPEYIPMGPDYPSSIAFEAARLLIFEGTSQPNGYTEPLLHQKRKEMKAKLAG